MYTGDPAGWVPVEYQQTREILECAAVPGGRVTILDPTVYAAGCARAAQWAATVQAQGWPQRAVYAGASYSADE